ncbi:hypothetical protein CTEN210_09721 [Chaetoceros tenuissimus]|uniref:J domain-containing protein n=1 Tax=Chaetoceros tenuissimus TaxID=426638 RepID=A0AAD3CYH2_9STRA|nr:hypothetical protein CTEN210_09721 [Chaetoceros tenuissimus]
MKTTTLLVSNYLFFHSHAFSTFSFPSISSPTSSRTFTRLHYQSIGQEQNQDDVYAVLNLDPETCTLDVLKATYRQWAKAYHPDSILNPDSTEQERKLANDHFAIINSAYDELTNRFMNGEDYISIAAAAVHAEATATVDATTATSSVPPPNGEQHVGYGHSFGAQQQQQQVRTQYATRPTRTASTDDERFMPDEVLKQRKTATVQEESQPFVDYQHQNHQQHAYSAHNYSTQAHPAHNGHVYHTHPYQHHDQYNQQQAYQGHEDAYNYNQQQAYQEQNQMFEQYRKFQLFSIGDTVRVRVGKHKGSVGVVVKVSNAMLKIQIGQTNSVTIETKYVKRVLEEDLVQDASMSHEIHDVKRLGSEQENTMVWTDVQVEQETVPSTAASSSGSRMPMTLGMDGIYR